MLKLLNGLDIKTINHIRTSFPGNVDEIESIARDLGRGKVEFFGLRGEVDKLLAGIDPWTKEIWPDEHYKKIYFNPGHAPGDVKFLWEFMKHNFLPTAAKAYKLTGEEKYVDFALEFMQNWLKSVEAEKGVSWAGHPHICQRMINWLFFLEIASDAKNLTESLRTKFDAYLDEQWLLLEKEYHAPINNHKLLSLSFVILHRLYHSREAELEFWLEELKGSTELLIFNDGGFAEQSISYHRFSVESLMLVAQGLKNAGLSIPLWLSSAIEKSLYYFDALTQPSGTLPVFGDNSDEILLVREWPEAFWDLEYLFALGYGMGLAVRPAEKVPASSYWLLGLEASKQPEGKPARPETAEFNRTGHFVLREQDNSYVFFRAGEFGLYIPNASNNPHSHCDQLGLVAFLEGSEILTDPGTYRYNENDYERMIMKDESFHSTIKVNGKPQARYLSSFAYGEALNAEGKIIDKKLIGKMARDGWQFTREIELTKEKFVINDCFLGNAEVEWFFALSPFLTPQKIEPGSIILKEIGSLKLVRLEISEPLTMEILPGYVSWQYNKAYPSQRIWLKSKVKGEKRLSFSFEMIGKDLSQGQYR